MASLMGSSIKEKQLEVFGSIMPLRNFREKMKLMDHIRAGTRFAKSMKAEFIDKMQKNLIKYCRDQEDADSRAIEAARTACGEIELFVVDLSVLKKGISELAQMDTDLERKGVDRGKMEELKRKARTTLNKINDMLATSAGELGSLAESKV